MHIQIVAYVVILNSIVFYFGAAVHVSSDQTPFFRKDYVFNDDTQSFYKFHSIRKNWADAVQRCNLEGAKLLIPETQLERDIAIRDFVKNKIPEKSEHPWIWLGIHDQFSEGDFVTTDGRPLDEVFVDWWKDEPNNENNEDCVAMQRTGKMYDIDCDKINAVFICQKSRTTLEWNHFCNVPDMKYIYNKELGKCYKLDLTPRNWQDAYAVCTAEQSYLAIINSQAEADHFVNIIQAAPTNDIRAIFYYSAAAYLGFHNHFLKGWTTVKGQSLNDVGYTKWAQGQPDNAGDERCGSMFFDGGLNDLTCALNAIFICEHDIDYLVSDFHERFNNLNNSTTS